MTDGIGVVSIVIVDDHPVVRQGLRTIIEKQSSFKVVAEAGDGRAALKQIHALRPKVVVLDISMPGLDGLSLAEQLHRELPDLLIVFLTIHREPEFFEKALAVGANGYVLKDTASVEIAQCIDEVVRGRYYASASLAGYLMQQKRARSTPAGGAAGISQLTPTERQVLLLLAEYKTSSEIAGILHVSPRTVDTHRANICNKLELRGRHALMKLAIAHYADLR